MNKRFLITGGCGFIGKNFMDFMLKRGFTNFRILDNLSVGSIEDLESVISEHGTFEKNKVNSTITYTLSHEQSASDRIVIELQIGDIRNIDDCCLSTKNVRAVVHFAAQAGVIPSVEDPYFDFEVNARGTLNLLHAAKENRVEKFIFASSNAPLGEQVPPLSEEKATKPLSPYGASKLACEAYCSAFYGSYGLKTVSFRFSNVYGPYCLHKNSVIAKFIKDGLTKGTLTIYGDGTQTRDFIHVEDLCNAISVVLNPESLSHNPKIWGEVFHLGIGKEASIMELANYIKRLFENDVKIIFTPERKGEIKRNYSDITKAKNLLGFSPEISLDKGIKAVYKWFLNKNIDEIKDAQVLSGSE